MSTRRATAQLLNMILTLLLSLQLYISGTSSEFTVPQEICPGHSPVFSCTVDDPSVGGLASTYWTVTVNGTEDDDCILNHPQPSDMEACGPGNEFESSLGDPVGTLYPSTLTVDSISTQLNGTIVECAGPSPSNVIGDTTICIVGGVLVPSVVLNDPLAETCEMYPELNVRWSAADISCDGSVEYELSVTPPTHDCQSGSGDCKFNPNITQMNLNVTVGETYRVCVRAIDGCGNVQMPDCIDRTIDMEENTPGSCNYSYGYNIMTSDIETISTTWQRKYFSNGTEATYTAVINSGSGDERQRIMMDFVCDDDKCIHMFSNSPSLDDSVTVEFLRCTTTLTQCTNMSSRCVPSDLLQISSISRGPECQISESVGECTICSDDDNKCAVYDGISEGSRAVYSSSTDYCLNRTLQRICMNDKWSGEEPIIVKVTTETKLEAWNIALIVIGVTAYIIGVCVATVLGTLLFLRASTRGDGVLAVVVLVASGLLFPLAAVLCFVMKNKELDEKRLQLKIWYKILMGTSVVITIICPIMWLVLIGYITTNDFYDEGYIRGDNSECEYIDSNDEEKRVRNGLVIVCFLLSLLVLVVWSVCATLWGRGVVDSSDGAPPKPRRSKKSKKEEADQELETYETLQHAHKQPSSPQPLLSAGDPTYGRLNAQQQQEEDEQQYDHVQREKKKAVPDVNDPNYSHFASGGAGGQHYGKLDHGTGTGKGGTLPGSVPPTTDEYGKLDKNRGGGEEYAVVTNEARHKPKKTGH